ncbi:MAG: acetolactate decarboxylase [Thermoguttaceae bacterium]|nr:acetolactate decarboxylase [Thermoguttaceae bacterium]
MPRKTLASALPVAALILAALACFASAEELREPAVTQFATLDSLVAGVYDGFATAADLRKHGNFGIGTLDRIDGEVVIDDGVVYQIKGDGSVARVPDSATTPFASVAEFEPSQTTRVEGLDFEALGRAIDKLAPDAGAFVAFRLRGKFSQVRTRSSFPASKPYPPLVEALKNQPEFEIGAASGTLLGFRTPGYMRGLNLPGYHAHFLTADATRGGHVLRARVEEATLEIATLYRFQLILPPSDSAFHAVDAAIDRTADAQTVEGAGK